MKNSAFMPAPVALALVTLGLFAVFVASKPATARVNFPVQAPEVAVEAQVPEEPNGECITPELRARIDRRIAEYEAKVMRAGGAARFAPTTAPQAYPFHPQAGSLWQDLFL